jgi:putative ABC transport system permease protein
MRTQESPNRPVAQSQNRWMFWRLGWRSLSVKRPQAALAVGSLVVGAAVASMLLNLYAGARREMTQEFRAYGPNVLLAPAGNIAPEDGVASAGQDPLPGGVMDNLSLARLPAFAPSRAVSRSVPLLTAIVRLRRLPRDPRLPEFQNAVAVGTDFQAYRKLFPAWKLRGTPAAGGGAVIGERVTSQLHLAVGDTLQLEAESAPTASSPPAAETFRVAAILSTGASEDDQVFVPLEHLQKLTGLEGKISMVAMSVPGDAAEIERTVGELRQTLAGVEVRPLRQIVYASGKVLGTIRGVALALTALIIAIIVLCVTATMTAIVLERRKDVAVMKALGAGDRTVMRLFLAEGAALGLVGSVLGYSGGVLLARAAAERMFGATVGVVGWTLPAVCLGGALLGALATFFPVRAVRSVQPATVLKGE